MVVIRELPPGRPRLRARVVEALRDALVVVEGAPRFRRDPRRDEVVVPDDGRRLERRAALIRREGHVNGRGHEPVVVEQGAHVAWRLPEVVRELDLPVAGRRHPGQCAGEVLLQLAPDGVELQPDAVEPTGRAGRRGPPAGERCGGRPDERASVHHSSCRFSCSTACAAARAVSAM